MVSSSEEAMAKKNFPLPCPVRLKPFPGMSIAMDAVNEGLDRGRLDAMCVKWNLDLQSQQTWLWGLASKRHARPEANVLVYRVSFGPYKDTVRVLPDSWFEPAV
jgi:hypothetical protein